MDQSIVSIENVSKHFGKVRAVDDVSFEILPNEFFALLGPSGCGKTTLLRMIAGLEVPTSGAIVIDGQDMAATPPNRRPVNMVFQSYAVFPHMTVEENIGYGLKVTGTPKGEIATRAAEALEMVQLSELSKRKPNQLSGGQRQRVALARALVKRPKVLLLDEPLSALDAKLREQMQLELAHLQQRVGITFIIVTHDQDEALSMADRIAVMNEGKVTQIATPDALYESPTTRFVADFIGKVNLIDGHVTGAEGARVVVEADRLGRVAIPHGENARGEVSLVIRPEKILLSNVEPTGDVLKARGKVTDWAYYGATSHMFVTTESDLVISAKVQNTTRETVDSFDVGDQVWLSFSPSDVLVLSE